RCQRAAKTRPADVHAIPNVRAGEGVPHQPLPDPPAPDRDGPCAVSDGAADQDLVPEPPDEAQEGNPSHQGAERAGEAGPGPEGSGGGGAGSVARAK
ncbi:hypothetical protein pipiens_000946, partial [Culex pipiens pipiens]